jgi:hypothetical protein
VVSISPDVPRNDLIAASMDAARFNPVRQSNCEWNNCSLESKSFTLLTTTTPEQLAKFIKQFLPSAASDLTHVVVTLQLSQHVVHIVDMLVKDSGERQLRLMDKSWVSYLRPTLLLGDFYIDLILVLLDNNTRQGAEQNTKLLNLNSRIAAFLAQFRALQTA